MAIHATQKEVEEFERLLGQAGAGEGPIQAFLEMHSEFVPTPFVLGHNVNLGVIISKFQIDTNLVTDFTYITKNSAKWQVVFIEIEDPEKKIFKDSSKYRAFTAEFNDALAQVKEWRDHAPRVKAAILTRLEPLLQPTTMRRNPVSFRYVLVYGRRAELDLDQKRLERFSNESTSEFEVMTFDACSSEAQSSAKPRRNVIGHVGDGYCFKAFRAAPGTLFSWVNVKYFRLTQSEQDLLINAGLDMPSWLAGKDLSVNGAKPKFSFSDPSAFQVSQAVEKLLYP
ncbi:MAG: DUF4263 domain-containing protein [Verrucomicrobia bacterium]|nr:DUF4263 domain-containing protein [Verrucomicrobiota bacterium]